MLFPRLVGRAKRITPPEQLRTFDLAPRHLSLLSLLLLDGPQTVSQLAARKKPAHSQCASSDRARTIAGRRRQLRRSCGSDNATLRVLAGRFRRRRDRADGNCISAAWHRYRSPQSEPPGHFPENRSRMLRDRPDRTHSHAHDCSDGRTLVLRTWGVLQRRQTAVLHGDGEQRRARRHRCARCCTS